MSILMFLTNLLPKDFRKDGFLYFSAILTWALVSFIYLKTVTINLQSLWQASALIAFIGLFFNNISHKKSPFNFSLTIIIEVGLLLVLIYFDNKQIIPILFALIASQLPAHFSRKKAMLILVIINSAYYVTLITAHPQQSIYTVLIFFVLQIFAFSVIEATLREQRAKEEISTINQELLATRFMLKESSQKQERLRISRDLHDVLGHQLTALALNLEVTQHKLPDEYKPLAEENLQQARQLLQGVRNVVKKMRDHDKLDLIAHINKLFAQLPNCQFHLESSSKSINESKPTINSLTLNNQLIFCLQEAISNALRHGKANIFTLDFQKTKNIINIQLTDNGKGCDKIIMGNGLKGMQERLKEFNGTVILQSNNKNKNKNNQPALGCTLHIQVEDSYD
ncbi:MAG: hypothetical protein JKX78_01620 [Alteromonadaceae bacterium]|nr:hypothetical protein [Alteromonadaceae bacterium]